MAIVSATGDQGTPVQTGQTVTSFIALDPGSSSTMTIVARAYVPGVGGGTASVTADPADPTPGDNTVTQNVTVVAPAPGGGGGSGSGGTGTGGSTTGAGTGGAGPVGSVGAVQAQPGPRVLELQGFRARRATTLVLTFDQPLDPTRALNSANYLLTTAAKHARPHRTQTAVRIPIRSVAVDPTGTMVTLVPGARLVWRRGYSLTVHGDAGTGLTGRSGHAINGGADYVAQIISSTFVGTH
jgi:hypothetical protein